MSIGSLNVIGALAGQPATAKSATIDRTQQDSTDQSRQVSTDKNAEKSAGIGQTEQEQDVSERDADGRRSWEDTRRHKSKPAVDASSGNSSAGELPPQSKDPAKQVGTRLDLSG